MSIIFEEVTGEVAPRTSESHTETQAPAPDTQSDMREKLACELALLRERQARLFTD
jgi:hypothetical protein